MFGWLKLYVLYELVPGKVILHPDLEGAPLLILANKQDRPDSLPLTEVESAFNTSAESIGDRDCKIQRVSALKG